MGPNHNSGNMPQENGENLKFGINGGNLELPDEHIMKEKNENPPSPDYNDRDKPKASLSPEEQNDPNAIRVTIADDKTPVVVFFGPPACGKTMTLIRLTSYLRKNGYTITPVTSFRPSYDTNYKRVCDDFNSIVTSFDAAKSTPHIDFMLVQVLTPNGRALCQILEGPGEYYFNPECPDDPFPAYVNTIINCGNRKIWTIFVEPDGTSKASSQSARENYVLRIKDLKTRFKTRDKVIFLFNKVDITPYVMSPGRVNEHELARHTNNVYRGIFDSFKNVHPITKIWRTYNCKFLPFQTGNYTKTVTGGLTYQEGPDEYPRMFWKKLLSLIKGS